jgi:hypothetical protein
MTISGIFALSCQAAAFAGIQTWRPAAFAAGICGQIAGRKQQAFPNNFKRHRTPVGTAIEAGAAASSDKCEFGNSSVIH